MQVGLRDAELLSALLGEGAPRADHGVALLCQFWVLHDARAMQPRTMKRHDRLVVWMQIAGQPHRLAGDLEVLG